MADTRKSRPSNASITGAADVDVEQQKEKKGGVSSAHAAAAAAGAMIPVAWEAIRGMFFNKAGDKAQTEAKKAVGLFLSLLGEEEEEAVQAIIREHFPREKDRRDIRFMRAFAAQFFIANWIPADDKVPFCSPRSSTGARYLSIVAKSQPPGRETQHKVSTTITLKDAEVKKPGSKDDIVKGSGKVVETLTTSIKEGKPSPLKKELRQWLAIYRWSKSRGKTEEDLLKAMLRVGWRMKEAGTKLVKVPRLAALKEMVAEARKQEVYAEHAPEYENGGWHIIADVVQILCIPTLIVGMVLLLDALLGGTSLWMPASLIVIAALVLIFKPQIQSNLKERAMMSKESANLSIEELVLRE